MGVVVASLPAVLGFSLWWASLVAGMRARGPRASGAAVVSRRVGSVVVAPKLLSPGSVRLRHVALVAPQQVEIFLDQGSSDFIF